MFDFFQYWKSKGASASGGAANDMTALTSLNDLAAALPGLNAPASQHQSPFFKLPAELRVKIWKYAMSGELIHIEHSPVMRCHEPPEPVVPVAWAQLHREERLACGKTWAQKESLSHLNWHFTSTVCGNNATLPDGQVVPKNALLGLSLSCRRIHGEAFPFLYPTNAFAFRTPRDFLCFTTTIPQASLDSIRLVHIRVELHTTRMRYDDWHATPPPLWDECCAALRAMQGLEALQFTIDTPPEETVGLNQEVRARLVEEVFQDAVGRRLQGGMGLVMMFEDEWLRRVLVERQSAWELRTRAPWLDCGVVFAS